MSYQKIAKKIIIIVEGGTNVGMGHLVQSLAVADLIKYESDVLFLSKGDNVVINKIEKAGYNVLKVEDDEDIKAHIGSKMPDIVIIDNLYVPEGLAKIIKEQYKAKLVIFTNISDANKYADITVFPGIGNKINVNLEVGVSANHIRFYGPKYWIMRSDFNYYHGKDKKVSSRIKSILCLFGGSDPMNFTTNVTNELLDLSDDYRIRIVLGAKFAHKEEFEKLLIKDKKSNKIISVENDVCNVAELMYFSDLTLTSPGLSAFESLYVGTPIIVFPQNRLQREEFLGNIELLEKKDIPKIKEYIESGRFTYPSQDSIANLHIGEGADEVIKAILG